MEFDAIVVGGGAAGAAITWHLSQSGHKVLCLERGPWMNPQNYPSTKHDWELLKDRQFSAVPAQRQSIYDYPINDSGSPIAICNFNAVGGSTILYSGHYPRFRPPDFSLRTSEGVGEDWPIGYEQLRPFFELNEQETGVSGLVGDPAYPDIKTLLPPVPLGECGRILAEAFNHLNWHWWPSYAAISTRDRAGRNACINLGPCNTGCPQQAKSSADITYMKRAKLLGAEIVSEVAVDRILVKNGKAYGVHYRDANGAEMMAHAKIIILAASAIGTPRILLNSKSEDYPHGLGNHNDQVGRNLMLHPLGLVEGIFDKDLDTDVGPQGCLIYSLEHYRDKKASHKLGYMMHALRGSGPLEAARYAWLRRRLKFGPSLYSNFHSFYRRQMAISIICEDLPEPENRVTLDETATDIHGGAGVKITYKMGENTKAIMASGMKNARILLKTAGASKTFAYGPVRNTGWHTMGTCRMGENPNRSVTNASGECHSVSNLYIADSSLFASGSCVNPANTVQALALFIGSRIAERLRGGAE